MNGTLQTAPVAVHPGCANIWHCATPAQTLQKTCPPQVAACAAEGAIAVNARTAFANTSAAPN